MFTRVSAGVRILGAPKTPPQLRTADRATMAPASGLGDAMTNVIQWLSDNRTWVFSGIGVAALGWSLRWLFGRRTKATNPEAHGDARTLFDKRKRPLELEIQPQHFELNLDNEVPEIRVYLFAINYLDSPIKLSTVRVDHFRLSVGTVLDGIALAQEVTLNARRCHHVMCRRVLVDSETRTFLKGAVDPRPSASVTLSARGQSGRKMVEFGPNSSVSMNGYISKPSGTRAE